MWRYLLIGCFILVLLISLRAFPSDPLSKGNRLYVHGNYKDAIAEYEKSVNTEDSKTASEALYLVGKAYEDLEQWETALSKFQKLVDKFKDSEWVDEAMLEIGNCSYELGNAEEALRLYEQVRKEFPERESAEAAAINVARLKASFINIKTQNIDDAIVEYNSFIKKYPDSRFLQQAYYGLGLSYRLKMQFEKAKDAYRKAIEENPQSRLAGLAHLQLYSMLLRMGRQVEVRRLLTEPAQRYSLYNQYAINMNQILKRNVQQVWVHQDKSIQKKPDKKDPAKQAEVQRYIKPLMHYKDYFFSTDVGTLDTAQGLITCEGNVQFNDNFQPPRLIVKSGSLIIRINEDVAIFKKNVFFKKWHFEPEKKPTLFENVEELQFFLDTGDIKIPQKQTPSSQ